MGRGSREPAKWWQMRTSMEKTLISFSIILTLTFFIVLLVGITLHGNTSSDGSIENALSPPCITKDCLIAAGKMLDMMNSTINPCHDFYEFACGRYTKTHSAPLNQPEASIEHETSDAVRLHLKHWLESEDASNTSTYKQARDLYKTCIHFDQTAEPYDKTIQKILRDEKIGNWPTLDPHWFDSDASLEERLASLILHGVPVGFNLEVVEDSKNQGKYIVKISPGRPLLTFQDESEIRDNLMIKLNMEAVLLLLGVQAHKAAGDVEEILSEEAVFIKIKRKEAEDCGSPGGGFNNDLGTERMQLVEMDRRMPEVNWTKIIRNVFNDVNAGKDENSQIVIQEVDVYCRRYITEYIGYLEQLTQKAFSNYLGWRFWFTFIQYLAPPFHRLHLEYQNYMIMETPHSLYQPRWKECFSLVEHYMLPVLAKIYKDQEISDAVLKEKMKIAHGLRSSMTDLLLASDWLEEHDKQKIKQKVSNSKFDLSLAKLSSNWDLIEEWFSHVNINPSHHLLENVLKMQRFQVANQLKRIQNPNTEILQWNGMTLTSPSHSIFQGNSIQVHFDRIRPPFLRPEEGSSLNHGAFGSYLSRTLFEYIISFNFSTVVDSERISIFWDAFQQRRDSDSCFADEIPNSFTEDEKRTLINAVLTELGAIQVSHLAYNKHQVKSVKFMGLKFSRDQMFFLSYAQTLCEVRDNRHFQSMESNVASNIRVNFALRNFPAFGKTFNCPSESHMNPSSKCQVLD